MIINKLEWMSLTVLIFNKIACFGVYMSLLRSTSYKEQIQSESGLYFDKSTGIFRKVNGNQCWDGQAHLQGCRKLVICYALVQGHFHGQQAIIIGLLEVKGRQLETKVMSCPKQKVGSPDGPSFAKRDLSESTSHVVPDKASKQAGQTGHMMRTSELLNNAQALGSMSL